ncbi:Ribosomal RNA-processing protein 15 like protein [Aduncisulcus paluster]|uniref:Ribosomal RNA-processing protein 15 like protein n=1 Tax=Aduncisulcus paluster TaxID=2918883 RepID=A0ABQ5JS18_9EUKA|nr:Ribosomal RNA-processing protein 15 like protein [Aduncisulcus paluster]
MDKKEKPSKDFGNVFSKILEKDIEGDVLAERKKRIEDVDAAQHEESIQHAITEMRKQQMREGYDETLGDVSVETKLHGIAERGIIKLFETIFEAQRVEQTQTEYSKEQRILMGKEEEIEFEDSELE